MNLDMTIFHQAFFEEAADLLTELETQLLRLEEAPDDSELLNTIFRCAHSIKGGSATFGFTDIAHFTHGLETLLDRLRNGQTHVSAPLTQLLLESLDQLKALLSVARGEAALAPNSEPLIARIDAAIALSDGPKPAAVAPSVQAQTDSSSEVQHYIFRFVPNRDVLRQGSDPLLMLKKLCEQVTDVVVRCSSADIPGLEDFDPEACYVNWELEFNSTHSEQELLEPFEFVSDECEVSLTAVAGFWQNDVSESQMVVSVAPTVEAVPVMQQAVVVTVAMPVESPVNAAAKMETHTLRVSTDKIDKLINLVGELVINQSMLNEVVQHFEIASLPRLLEAVAAMERASRELQERVMAVRMLPIKHAFGRFPRLVRDLAASCHKKIDLKTTGEDTELDKSVIEMIADPLTHLVRNSIDHGLETPAERVAAGKPEMGIVSLNAFHEGGNIVVEVSDDGRGLDKDRIYRKAIDRGLLSENDPMPADDVLHNYIFHPGFSTAAAVTDLSGRGVGMDIVKQAVQGLGGAISLSSTPGKGSRFRIRLPLTMAILEGLSLRVGEEVYILPLTSIIESIRPKQGDVRVVAGQTEVAMVRGEVLPILRLYQFFGVDPVVSEPTRGLLVIVENDGRKIALLVDELIGQSQVVIKSLESNYRKVDGIAGATILGDGRVALIIDVPGLYRNVMPAHAVLASAA